MPYRMLYKARHGNILIAELPLDPMVTVQVFYLAEGGKEQTINVWNPPTGDSHGVVVNQKLALIPVMSSLPAVLRDRIELQISQLNTAKQWPVCRSVIIGRPLQIKMPPGTRGTLLYTLGMVLKLRLSDGSRVPDDHSRRR